MNRARSFLSTLFHSCVVGMFAVSAAPAFAQALLPENAPAANNFCKNSLLLGKPPALPQEMAMEAISICTPGYAVHYSNRSKTPVFSAYYLDRQRLAQIAALPPFQAMFHADRTIQAKPSFTQVGMDNYSNTKWMPQPMTPPFDMPTEYSRWQSFSLMNTAPMHMDIAHGIWNRIEESIRNHVLSKSTNRGGAVYVVTGPVYIGTQFSELGPSKVLVPSAFYKAVYFDRLNTSAVYWVENSAVNEYELLTVDEFVRRTSIDPFPTLPHEIRSKILQAPLPMRFANLNLLDMAKRKPYLDPQFFTDAPQQ